MNQNGFTLIEALVAMSILSIALVGMVPGFQTFLDANSVSEERSNGLAAAQNVMEALREADPGSLPTSGTSPVQAVTVGQHEYEVVVHYCTVAMYCNAASRHVLVEVDFAGKNIYTVESVFTRLR